MQVFQNHFHQIVNGSTNRCSGTWRQSSPAENITTAKKTQGTAQKCHWLTGGEGGLGEFLGHQSKKVTEHWPRNFCDTCNPLPVSHVPSPVLPPNVTGVTILKGKPQPGLYHLPFPSWVKSLSRLLLSSGQNGSLFIQLRALGKELVLVSLPHPIHQTSGTLWMH